MRLLLVRHGESTMTRTYTGRRSDPELSEQGKEQVSRLTRHLSSERIERIYSSPLKRALQTAEALRVLSPRQIILREDLSEMDFGLWDGLTHDQISKKYPAEYAEWINDPVGKTPIKGESIDQLSQRVLRAFHQITRDNPEDTVAVISHGGPIRVLLCELLGMDLSRIWQFQIDTASVTTLIYSPDYPAILVSLNTEL